MTHRWFDAESRKELKKLQMSNPNAETQNLSTHFASSSDTDPQRWWWVMGVGVGVGVSLVRLCFALRFPDACTAVTRCRMNECSVVSAHICPRAESAPYLRLSDTLILFGFTAQTARFFHLCCHSGLRLAACAICFRP